MVLDVRSARKEIKQNIRKGNKELKHVKQFCRLRSKTYLFRKSEMDKPLLKQAFMNRKTHKRNIKVQEVFGKSLVWNTFYGNFEN